MVEAGSNLRLENKLMTMDYDTAMRSWMANPEDSESRTKRTVLLPMEHEYTRAYRLSALREKRTIGSRIYEIRGEWRI